MGKHEDCSLNRFESRTHSFPNLQQDPVDKRSAGNAREHFQPMFQCGLNGYTPAFACEPDKDGVIDESLCEEARQKGYSRGFDAGKITAQSKAREALQPDLIDFLQAFENVSAFHQHVTETASNQIVQMALHMCRQVLGQSIDLEPKEADTLHRDLLNALGQAHQLTLAMNTEDTSALQDLTAGCNLTWPNHNAVAFKTEPDAARGKMYPLNSDGESDALRRFLQQHMSVPSETNE